MFSEEFLCSRKVVGRVDADGFDIGEADADAIAVLQPTELFEALGLFERRGRQLRDFAKDLAAVGVEADVLQEGEFFEPVAAVDAAHEGNDAAREIECETVVVEHDFRRIFVFDGFHRGERLAERGDLRRRVVELAAKFLDLRGLDEGFVALHVDDDVGLRADGRDGFLNAVGAAAMVRGSHHGASAEAFHFTENPLVVGSDKNFFDDLGNLSVNALNHGFSAEQGQWLAGEARRGVAGRDDCSIVHSSQFIVHSFELSASPIVNYQF